LSTLAALASALLLPGFAPVATEPHGGQLYSGVFPGTPRAGYVYLPPSFDPAQRYPVVYLLHGLPGSPSEYVNGTDLGGYADAQIASGAVRPFIAVIPAAGQTASYGGEWAGGTWEQQLVQDVVPWIDSSLPTIATRPGRVIAGLSAGGYGAVDIALRHPALFGAAESWSGYFVPLPDGPFKHATAATLAANDPVTLVQEEASELRRDGIRFFVSTGPLHSHTISPHSTFTFARELRSLSLPVVYRSFPNKAGEWRDQMDAGLTWAFAS
jgi:enterochelin esterase-like enzyme